MSTVYVYENHDGFEDDLFLSSSLLTDSKLFCPFCEDWDNLLLATSSINEFKELLKNCGICKADETQSELYDRLIDEFERIEAAEPEEFFPAKEELEVGLYFCINGRFAFWGCPLKEARSYGDFLIFDESHFDVWSKTKYLQYDNNGSSVDYDYYPRGRVVYRKSDDTFIFYYDRCVENDLPKLICGYDGQNVRTELDEHYCCHLCNKAYENIFMD